MFAQSSTAIEHEIAYRRHQLETQAARASAVRLAREQVAERNRREQPVAASTTKHWWQRAAIAR